MNLSKINFLRPLSDTDWKFPDIKDWIAELTYEPDPEIEKTVWMWLDPWPSEDSKRRPANEDARFYFYFLYHLAWMYAWRRQQVAREGSDQWEVDSGLIDDLYFACADKIGGILQGRKLLGSKIGNEPGNIDKRFEVLHKYVCYSPTPQDAENEVRWRAGRGRNNPPRGEILEDTIKYYDLMFDGVFSFSGGISKDGIIFEFGGKEVDRLPDEHDYEDISGIFQRRLETKGDRQEKPKRVSSTRSPRPSTIKGKSHPPVEQPPRHEAKYHYLRKPESFVEQAAYEDVKKKLRAYRKCRNNPLFAEFLIDLYSGFDLPILERCRQRYPVVFVPAGENQYDDLRSVVPISKLFLEDEEKRKGRMKSYIIRDDSYRGFQKSVLDIYQEDADVQPLENRYVYAMETISLTGSIQVSCWLGCFFDMLDTYDCLYFELVNNWLSDPPKSHRDFSRFRSRLTLRNILHEEVENPLVDGTGRCGGMGILVLTAFRLQGQDEVKMWIRLRSNKVAAVPDLYHVIPAGMFQPMTGYYREEYNIEHNVYREYIEEVFGRREPKANERARRPYRFFYKDKCLDRLRAMLTAGTARLIFTGVAINLPTLRPEICMLLYIDDPEWYEYHSTRKDREGFLWNYEYESNEISAPFEITYSKDDDQVFNVACTNLKVENIVPGGAATFWMGKDVLDKIL